MLSTSASSLLSAESLQCCHIAMEIYGRGLQDFRRVPSARSVYSVGKIKKKRLTFVAAPKDTCSVAFHYVKHREIPWPGMSIL